MSSRTLLRSGWALKCNPMQACAPLCQQIAGACRWAAICVLPRAKLVGVVAASVCARVRRGRGPPHVRAFSRQLLCDRYARVDCCDFVPANRGILPLLWRSLHPWGSNVRRGPDYVRRLHTKMRGTKMHTPFSYPFTRPMSWSVYPTNEGSLTYELAEESVVTRRCPGLFISQHLGCVGWYEGCACAARAWVVCPIARRCDLSGDVFSEGFSWVAYLHASYGADALRFE